MGVPTTASRSVDIAAPPPVVWGLIADHVGWPKWFTTLDAVEVLGAGSGVGGGRRVTVKKLALDEQFTAWDEDQHFAFAVVKSKIPILDTMAESVKIEATDDGCRVDYRQGLQAKRGMGKALELMWKPAAKGLEEALANLKRLAESAA